MADEMTVNQRPSALPYALGGAAIGGGGAYALSRWGHVGIPTVAYKSWEDAVAAVNKDDSFVNSKIDKGGDNAGDWKTIKEQAGEVKKAQEAYDKIVGEAAEEAKAFSTKLDEVSNQEKEMLDKLLKGEVKIGEGENAKTLLETLIDDELVQKFKNDTANKDKKFKINGNDVEIKNVTIKQAKELAEFKDWAVKQESVIDAAKKQGAYTKIRTGAQADIDKLKKAVTEKQKEFDGTKFNEAKENLAKANKNAEEKLTEDLLKKCKKPHNLITAAIGAAVLGLGALALRPKADA